MENQTAGQAPVGQPTGKKPRSATAIIIIILVVVVVLGIGGYLLSRYLVGRIAKEATEGIIGGLTGGEVDLDADNNTAKISSEDGSFEISAGGSWPEDLPGDVPQFTAGVIEASSKSTVDGKGGWSLSFTKVEANAFENYREKLLAAQWSETGTASTDSKITNMENENYYLIFTIKESNHTGSLAVTSK